MPAVSSGTISMFKIEPPDSHYLSAAIGWTELGNTAEARAELENIKPKLQLHPQVLEARWVIAAQEQHWDEALTISRDLLREVPDHPAGWLHQSYALRRVSGGGLQNAWESLLPAAEKFPKEPTVFYNLSCYACQMGDMVTARIWLKRAFKVGDRAHLKAMALEDSDLQPLWIELQEW